MKTKTLSLTLVPDILPKQIVMELHYANKCRNLDFFFHHGCWLVAGRRERQEEK